MGSMCAARDSADAEVEASDTHVFRLLARAGSQFRAMELVKSPRADVRALEYSVRMREKKSRAIAGDTMARI
jgi:hypothetical protein